MDSKKQRRFLILNLALAAFIFSIILFIIEGVSDLTYKNSGEGIELFGDVYKHVLKNYIKEIKPEEISKNAVEGILKNLDPYSSFLPPVNFNQLQEDAKGEFGGLGIEISTPKDYPRVMSYPLPDSPAESQGLRAGDDIVKIDGVSTYKMDINDVVSKLRGKIGTKVKIHVKRGGHDDLLEFEITRAKISLKNISYYGEIENDIGYIKLNKFNLEASNEMDEALKSFRKNKNLKGVILDIRSNPGGLLKSAQEIANKFIAKESLIVFTQGRDPGSRYDLYADKVPLLPPDKMPLVVLVNRASASASEIVAGAIQDHDRGVLIGETTFGKGSVQTVYDDLPGGAGIKLTTAYYHTPSGRCIHNERNLDMDYISLTINGEEKPENDNALQDSLKKREKFFTQNKERVVYGGGGITPDIIIKERRIGNIETLFYSQNVFMDFAVDYVVKHPDLPEDFTITDEIMNEFKEYISDETVFTYSVPGKSSLDKFKKTIEKEKFNGDIVEMIENLEKSLLTKQDIEFESHIDTIKRRLKTDIATTKFGSKMRAIASKEWDIQLQKAIEILNDTEKYQSILANGAVTGVVE